ncbi:transposase domain-containing protein [Paenibacillus phytorum]|uniref:transposase domain-containing protein n=1 Tax=Paenibacillus phytorum TaxID=2654977 RepID=UPI0035E43C65
MIYSVIETAKENGLLPFQYLKYLFEQLPQLPPKSRGARALFAMVIFDSDHLSCYWIGMGKLEVM